MIVAEKPEKYSSEYRWGMPVKCLTCDGIYWWLRNKGDRLINEKSPCCRSNLKAIKRWNVELPPPLDRCVGKYGIIERRYHEIQCGVCGAWYRSLGAHAWQAHGILANQYREFFGLNYTQSLDCIECTDKRRQIGKDRFAESGIPPDWKSGDSESKRKGIEKTKGRPSREQHYNSMIASHQPTIIKVVCSVCGKEFEVTLTDNRKTCSDDCWVELRKIIMHNPNHPAHSKKAKDKLRSSIRNKFENDPGYKEQYIERIHRHQKDWQKRVGPVAVSKSRRKALASMSPESKARFKAGQDKGRDKHIELMKRYRANPHSEESKKLRDKLVHSQDNRRKVSREDYGIIKQRAAGGDKHTHIAREYKCSPSLIDQIVRGSRDLL